MKKSFITTGLLSVSAFLFVACGGGGGSDGGNSEVRNQSPVAVAGEDQITFGDKTVTLDAGGSSDSDGKIVKYLWKEGIRTIGEGERVENLQFPDGTHKITLTVTDDDGAVASDSLVVTAECKLPKVVKITEEVPGAVNDKESNVHPSSCYSIDLTSNNAVETYTFYMNLLDGTVTNASFVTDVEIFDKDGESIHKFDTATAKMFGKRSMRRIFDISKDDKYYVRIARGGKQAAKYAFSIHPSIANGLKQDADHELNDEFSMAAPITLADAMADIKGNLNNARTEENSLKNTDSDDYYNIKIDKAGTYTFYMNLLKGTVTQKSYVVAVELFDENRQSVHKFDTVGGKMFLEQSFREIFDIDTPGNYYLRIYRGGHQPTEYAFSIHPSIANGLKQDADHELNDEFSMAAPITLADIATEMTGTLNTDRTDENSLKNTDDQDIYNVMFTTAGTFTLDANLYAGTVTNASYPLSVELFDENEKSVHRFSTSNMFVQGANVNESFTISRTGNYYLVFKRDGHEKATYGFTVK